MRKQFRIIEVSRTDEKAYVIQRRVFGLWWRCLRIPSIYFDFPFDWWRSFSVFDSEDDAEDALYSCLFLKQRGSDYTLSVTRYLFLGGGLL